MPPRKTVSPPAPKELPEVPFGSKDAWAAWLEQNHGTAPGVWLKFGKKGSGVKTVSYPEAVEVALCYGWIDGHKRPFDEVWWLQKFTPRGPKSIWSKINREKAEALIARGEMKPAGRKAVEAAKNDGRWERAYDSPSTSTVPEDLQMELDKNPKAKAFFATLNNANRYAILFRVHTAKRAETRARRIQQFVEMLSRHEKIHQ